MMNDLVYIHKLYFDAVMIDDSSLERAFSCTIFGRRLFVPWIFRGAKRLISHHFGHSKTVSFATIYQNPPVQLYFAKTQTARSSTKNRESSKLLQPNLHYHRDHKNAKIQKPN
jgi:hypothetical protein